MDALAWPAGTSAVAVVGPARPIAANPNAEAAQKKHRPRRQAEGDAYCYVKTTGSLAETPTNPADHAHAHGTEKNGSRCRNHVWKKKEIGAVFDTDTRIAEEKIQI